MVQKDVEYDLFVLHKAVSACYICYTLLRSACRIHAGILFTLTKNTTQFTVLLSGMMETICDPAHPAASRLQVVPRRPCRVPRSTGEFVDDFLTYQINLSMYMADPSYHPDRKVERVNPSKK